MAIEKPLRLDIGAVWLAGGLTNAGNSYLQLSREVEWSGHCDSLRRIATALSRRKGSFLIWTCNEYQ